MFLYILSNDFIHVYSPGAGGIQPPRVQSFVVNRYVLSLQSSVASLKSQMTIVSEKSIVLPFSYTKAKGTKFDIAVE